MFCENLATTILLTDWSGLKTELTLVQFNCTITH